jgi:Cu/Ag efflux protein CusF
VSLMFVSAVMAQEKTATSMAASAQEKTAKPMAAPALAMKLEKFNGVVENVDMAKKDVVVQYHKDRMNFSVGDKTKLFEGKKELKLSDLNKGLWASVEFQKEVNQLLAQSIHVSPVKHAKNTASSKGMTGKKMMPSEKTAENKMMSTEKTTENK